MQVTLNQQDILQAVRTYLGKIMSVPVDVVNLDIKGMRTTEGYTATVDVVIDGQEYVPVRPATPVIEVTAEPDTTDIKRHFEDTPLLSEADQKDLIKVLELIANNPRGKNDQEIHLLSNEVSPEVQVHLHANKAFMEVLDRIYAKNEEKPEEQEPSAEPKQLDIVDAIQEAEQAEEPTTSEPETEELIEIQTGVNFLGEPIIEKLTKKEIQERGLELTSEPTENKPEETPVKKGMFD